MNEKIYAVENHPQDSRVKFRDDDVCQTLPANSGMGGVTYHWFSLFVATRFAEYKETLPTLRASGGDTGGGGEALIVYENHRI